MANFMVWGSVKRPTGFQGGYYLDWSGPPLGVFVAADEDGACKAAAKKNQQFGTFFAVEGMPWGLDLLETEALELGEEGSAMDKLNSHLARMEQINKEANRLIELEQNVLGSDDLQEAIDEALAKKETK